MTKTTWLDQLGNPVYIGSFIVYGSGRGGLSFGIVAAEKNQKLKIQLPQFERKYNHANGVFEDVGWKVRSSTLSNAYILVISIDSLTKLHSWPESEQGDYEQQIRNLYYKLNER